MFKDRQEGDMLMDAPKTNSWRELCAFAFVDDKERWRTMVRSLKQPRVRVNFNVREEGHDFKCSVPASVMPP